MKKLQENINLTDALQEITGEYTEDYVSLHDQFQQVENFMLSNNWYNIQQDLYKSVTDPKAFRSKHVGSHKYANGRNKKKKNKRMK